MEVFTAFFSTNGTVNNAPIQTPSAANGYVGIWSFNADSLFGSRKYGQCRVKFNLRSSSFAVGAETNNTLSGSLRADFSSQHASVSNGVCLGFVNPFNDVITAASHLIAGDTTQTSGVTINVPTFSSTLTLRMVALDGVTPIPLSTNYQVLFYFEVDESHLESGFSKDRLFNSRPM
jgi:hypothetical protein